MTQVEIKTILSEAAVASTRFPPATDKQIDYLAILLARLSERGKSFAPFVLDQIARDGSLSLRAASNFITAAKAA